MTCTCDAGTEVVTDADGDPIEERCPACGDRKATFRRD